jgi:hypothetical protein
MGWLCDTQLNKRINLGKLFIPIGVHYDHPNLHQNDFTGKMTLPRYIVVSGYWQQPGLGQDWFHKLWYRNLLKYAAPDRVFILSSGNFFVPNAQGEWILLAGNLGSPDEVLHREKDFFCPACPAVWMAGAWLAYLNETDVIFLEQDCLAFGPWVEELYKQIGDAAVICGKNQMHGAATSLFLVKHHFIPRFVRHYLALAEENVLSRMAEAKMLRLCGQWPEQYVQHNFGCDKDRPLPFSDPVWYAQKFTSEELTALEVAGLISCAGMPPGVKHFTNHYP